MTSVWMFARAPAVMRPAVATVPVICPADAAVRLNLADCEDDRPQRVIEEHVVGEVELRGWRWVAAQVYPRRDQQGVFPWEVSSGGVVGHA